MNEKPHEFELYGILAEFQDAEALLKAASTSYDAGYRNMDAYTPYPITGLSRALGFRETRLPWVVLVGGIVGCVTGYVMQYVTLVHVYPINVGGRPMHSWPAFIPVTFEMTILVAAMAAVLGMLALNRLPMPHHPVFNVPSFAHATRDRFFLCVEADDQRFDRDEVSQFLRGLGAHEVIDVEK